ncbi:MAG TPA: ATP-binding protein, partial [Terriglobia bacterium]|nr:ATP-binding protein [Terriglobia bacterium]
ITNAIQAMPKGGRISVSALCKEMNGRDDVIEMRFADTGPGISPADRERVFAPYFSTKETGFGLGLAITKKIVEDHGGRIYATDGQMPGTVMVIELPLTRAAASRAALSSPAA